MNPNIILPRLTVLIADSTKECGHMGDLNGSPERSQGQVSREECSVRALAAGANGFSTPPVCTSTCNCFASSVKNSNHYQ